MTQKELHYIYRYGFINEQVTMVAIAINVLQKVIQLVVKYDGECWEHGCLCVWNMDVFVLVSCNDTP